MDIFRSLLRPTPSASAGQSPTVMTPMSSVPCSLMLQIPWEHQTRICSKYSGWYTE